MFKRKRAHVNKTFSTHTTAGEVTNLAQAYMVDAGKEITFHGFILEMSALI